MPRKRHGPGSPTRTGLTMKNQFWMSDLSTDLIYIHYFRRLTQLAISMFEWTNLPDTVDPRFLELTLFRDGHALFFEDDIIGPLAMRCTMNAPFNVYDVPINRRAYAPNNYQANRTMENSVIIYQDMLRDNMFETVEYFATALAQLETTIRINLNAQKTPFVIKCEESQRLTMKNLYEQYNGNVPFILGTKGLNMQDIQVINTGAPYLCDKLMEQKEKVWNEALTTLGISTNYIKSERLAKDEAFMSQGATVSSRYTRLNARQQACEEINEMFDLDIWCEFRQDYQTVELPGQTDAQEREPETEDWEVEEEEYE